MPIVMLHPGDTFCVSNMGQSATIFEKGISFIERLKDVQTDYNFVHSGIIVNYNGRTYESRLRVGYNWISDYTGCDIIIGRPKIQLSGKQFYTSFEKVYSNHDHEFYPIYRLPLHFLGVSKFIHWHKVVCSELVAQFLNYYIRDSNIYTFENWFGWEPGNLAYTFEHDNNFEIIYRGIWSNNLLK